MLKPTYTLTVANGALHLPSPANDYRADAEILLAFFYRAGDCDTIPWPKPAPEPTDALTWENMLARTIFDSVETGDITQQHGEFAIALPDGSEFDYQLHLL